MQGVRKCLSRRRSCQKPRCLRTGTDPRHSPVRKRPKKTGHSAIAPKQPVAEGLLPQATAQFRVRAAFALCEVLRLGFGTPTRHLHTSLRTGAQVGIPLACCRSPRDASTQVQTFIPSAQECRQTIMEFQQTRTERRRKHRCGSPNVVAGLKQHSCCSNLPTQEGSQFRTRPLCLGQYKKDRHSGRDRYVSGYCRETCTAARGRRER